MCSKSKSRRAGGNARESRRRAYLSGKIFVYPEGDPGEGKRRSGLPNGGGNPENADDDKDDFRLDYSNEEVVDDIASKWNLDPLT